MADLEESDDVPQANSNHEDLNPDVKDLFAEQQVQGKCEIGQDQPERPTSTAKEPAKPLQYHSQDGNKPAVHQGSGPSSTASDSSSDYPLRSDESKDFDKLDAGQLFADDPPLVAIDANDKIADRRYRSRPAELDLGTRKSGDRGSSREIGKDSYGEPLSSAKFESKIEQYVQDSEVKEKLLQEFRELNEGKNNIAIATWKLYEDKKKNLDELMTTYWSGPGEERRRIKAEKEARAKEVREAKRKRKVQIALAAEMRASEAAGFNGKWGTGTDEALVLPESEKELRDELGSGSGEDDEIENEDKVQQHEFYSPDSVGGNFQRYRRLDGLHTAAFVRKRDDDNDNEWPGDRTSRVPLTAFTAMPQTARDYRTRAWTASAAKPLSSVTAAETTQKLASIHILLRLIPLKAALAQHLTNLIPFAEDEKDTVHDLCALASSICHQAEDSDAPIALQGRCAFYMGLAEFLRSRVDEESEGIYALVVWYFDNAWKLCGSVYEEGSWGEQWARWLRNETGYFDDEGGWSLLRAKSPEQRSSGKEDSTKGTVGLGLVEKTMAAIRSWSGGDRKGFVWDKGVPELRKAEQPEKLLRAEDVPDVDVERPRPPQKRSAIGVSINTDGLANTKPIITSPKHAGIFASPERYNDGFESSSTTPTIDKPVNIAVTSSDAGPSPPTERRYYIANPGRESIDSSSDSTIAVSETLPTPVTTSGGPTVSPGGSGIMNALGRRLSTAMSPTSSSQDAKPPSTLPDTHDWGSETESPSSSPPRQHLSRAARRRKSSTVAQISSILRGGKTPLRSQDDLIEAEEGYSPMKAEFGGDVLRSTEVKRSPLEEETLDDGVWEA